MDTKHPKPKVPQPAPAQRRIEPLPGQSPKPSTEDPGCPRKLDAILNSASYIPAIQDADFLGGHDARGIRLQLDYLKPERLLRQHGVEKTIVVFGSTRIIEPAAAQHKVDQLQKSLSLRPGDEQLKQKLSAAKRVLAKSHYYDTAREFSHLVADAAHDAGDTGLVIMTGGGPGIMEAANRGVHDAGSHSVGLNISLPHEQYPNPYITPELCFQFHYFALRKLHFLLRAKALVAFPGGFGTFDELFETLTLIQTRKIKPVPVILVGESYWRKAMDIDFLVDEGTIDDEDRDLFWFAETAQEIWQGLLLWYERAGETLIVDDGTANKSGA